MKKLIIGFALGIITYDTMAQSSINNNPRIAFLAGLGIGFISNKQWLEPLSIHQFAVQLNSNVKFKIKRNQLDKRSWIYYSNLLLWMREPNSSLAIWANHGTNSAQDNIIHEQRIGFILRRWFLIEGGAMKELGTKKITGLTGGCGILFPIKNSSIELKGTFYFKSNFEQFIFAPSLVFHFDPKQ